MKKAAASWTQLHNLTWQGLLTSEALTTVVNASGASSRGLDTLDLSLAFPVDATTLPALMAGAPDQAHQLRCLHLYTKNWMETSMERQALRRVCDTLMEFSGLEYLYFYGDAQVLQEDESLRQRLASLSLLKEVRVCGVPQATLTPLNPLWEVKTEVHTRLLSGTPQSGTSATVLPFRDGGPVQDTSRNRYTHRCIRSYGGRGVDPISK